MNFSQIYSTFFVLLFLLLGVCVNSRVNVTCDLDLPEELHRYLPEECKTLSSAERSAAIEESNAFARWQNKLDEFEKRKDPNYTDIPKKQWELRAKMVNDTSIWTCTNTTNTNVFLFYKCLEDKRRKMLDMIPNE